MGMFALATMLLATSCSEDEIVAQSSGNEVTVSFTAQLRSDVKTKAVGDDTENVDQMIFAVYDESDKELVDLRQTITSFEEADNGKKTTTVNVVLVKGQTYSFAFWAQDKDYDAYDFNPATAEVTVNYGQTANNKSADAFFANVNNYTVNGSFEMDVTLKRPFAQVNFLVTEAELKAAKAAGFEPAQSSVTVQNAATSLNVLTGEVEGNTEATFNLANLISNEETTIKNAGEVVKLDGETETKFSYLATAYFLPTEATSQTEITASMKVTAEGKADIELSVPDIKAQRNYRTNIYGSLLTSKGEINVVIDPSFDVNSDYNVEQEEKDLYYTTLEAALKDNVNNTEALTYNVKNTDETDLSNVTITIPDATQATSLTFNLEDLAENATITIQNEDQDTDSYTGSVVVVVPEGVDLGKLTINMPNAHVTLQNGSYSEVDAITSPTTLVIPVGVKIGNITVNGGNAEIYYGTVTGNVTNKGKGTITWIIDSKEQLETASATTLEGILRIDNDIDFENAEFSAISVAYDKNLIVNGNNHTISNVKIVSGNADNSTGQASMFYGYTGSNISINNLTFNKIEVDADISGNGYAAVVVGYVEGNTVLKNVDVVSSTVYGEKSCGALVGYVASYGSATMDDCDVTTSSVEAKEDRTGAYVGRAQGPTTITNCSVDDSFSSVAPEGWNNKYIGQRYTDCKTCTVDGIEYVDTYCGVTNVVNQIEKNATVVLALAKGTYTHEYTNITSKNITIQPVEGLTKSDVVLDGLLFFNGTSECTIKNVTLTNKNAADCPGTKVLNNCILAAWGTVNVTVEDCIFNQDESKVASAIRDWWATGDLIWTIKNCEFNCQGQRPLQLHESATIEGCTFNEPYRYALQVNSSTERTMTMKNNKIVKKINNGKPAYFIQLTAGGSENTSQTANKTFIVEDNTFEVAEGIETIHYVAEKGMWDTSTVTISGSDNGTKAAFVEID